MIIVAFISSWFIAGPVQADQVVRIPYAVSIGGCSTGLAITNLSDSQIRDLTLDMAVNVSQASRTNLGHIYSVSMLVDFIDNMFEGTWEANRFCCEIWHSGIQEFAVTVFVMNISTGQAEGFGFYPFFSENRPNSLEFLLH